MENFETKQLPDTYEYLAPDQSEIVELTKTTNGSTAHCRLRPGLTSIAVAHRTIDEIWFFIKGEGEVWRKNVKTGSNSVTKVSAGTSLTIPLGTHFQFRNIGNEDLDFLIACIPPWPGDNEAFPVKGKWETRQEKG